MDSKSITSLQQALGKPTTRENSILLLKAQPESYLHFSSFSPEIQDEILDFLRVLSEASKNGLAPYLAYGRMIAPPHINCDNAPFGSGLPAVICTSWRYEGNDVLVLINPLSRDEKITAGDDRMILPRRSVRVINVTHS